MTPWSKVSQIEAGHFRRGDRLNALVDRHRIADNKPYIYRTERRRQDLAERSCRHPRRRLRQFGKEDPKTKGLLYAATELRVYVSFNDGAQWQPLQNNMPVTSIRDIVVHGDDLDIATHGRGFWVMDQMARCADYSRRAGRSSASAYLFKPGETSRFGGRHERHPLPHEEPQELNPPSGVVAYYLARMPRRISRRRSSCWMSGHCARMRSRATLRAPGGYRRSTCRRFGNNPRSRLRQRPECIDSRSVRREGAEAVSEDAAADCSTEPEMPAATGGGSSVPAGRGGRGGGGGGGRGGAGLQPGQYSVRLTVDGQTYTQPVELKTDPREVPGARQ